MPTAITVESLSKRYKLGLTHAGSIRELVNGLTDRLLRPLRRNNLASSNSQLATLASGEFWALRDVNLTINQGEIVGVIGRNGAGKSTLLKILSRITKPTSGRARIHGRVGSLLEVGTGFHPELTGRENIFLNGTMLGMSSREIARKLDQIIDFSEIEQFIDTPVKRYSSGMYVRLAFSVAAHLEPEVLIVDEVLAVGDIAFQRKCLGKMESVSESGRTVLFVSHNMGAVKRLCDRGVLLDQGRVIADGKSSEVVDTYLQHGAEDTCAGIVSDTTSRFGTGEARVRSVRLSTLSGTMTRELLLGQPFRVAFEFDVFGEIRDAHFEINFSTFDGVQLCVAHNELEHAPCRLPAGKHRVEAEFHLALLPRSYIIGTNIYRQNGDSIDFVERAFDFDVLRSSESEFGDYRWLKVRGYIRPVARWTSSLGDRLVPREFSSLNCTQRTTATTGGGA